ncbi:MAG: hypothetical protein GY869_00280 [Planctomycetes bacterium]|nr:hypothetical protein [Planctomycetota bacterium]
MQRFCDNTYCETEAVEEVPVSVNRSGDQKRSLCATCFEAYTWGVQHGRKTYQTKKVWVLAIADKGIIAHIETFHSKSEAEKGLSKYLQNYEQYKGSNDFEKALQWITEHDERLGVEITCQFIKGELEYQAESTMVYVGELLKEQSFVVLGQNKTDPSPEAPFEAWAYRGPMDFSAARPVTFGLGKNIYEALEALNLRLGEE